MFPDRAGWDLKAILLGKAVDYLALNVWAKTKAAKHGYGRPKSILPFGKRQKIGSHPKPAPLSVVKERMRRLHARRGPRSLPPGPPKTREERIKDIFKGD